MKKLTLILLVGMMLIVSGCGGIWSLRKASPEILKYQSTKDLIRASTNPFSLEWWSDSEIDQELINRQLTSLTFLLSVTEEMPDPDYINLDSKIIELKMVYMVPFMPLMPLGVDVLGDPFKIRDIIKNRYFIKHPEISVEIKEAMRNSESCFSHNLILGMTKDQVVVAIGSPNHINSSRGSWGGSTQYVYGGMGGIPIRCFYFENGRLTGWN